MPTNRRFIRRSPRTTLTRIQMMELWLGPGRDGSSFESNEHRRATWFRFRDKLMQLWGKDGRRPQGWWWYETPEGLRYPGYEHERSVLYETPGVLSEAERTALEARWREEFERTWSLNFSFFSGGRVFTGDVARELYWLWADLPPVLYAAGGSGSTARAMPPTHQIRGGISRAFA